MTSGDGGSSVSRIIDRDNDADRIYNSHASTTMVVRTESIIAAHNKDHATDRMYNSSA